MSRIRAILPTLEGWEFEMPFAELGADAVTDQPGWGGPACPPRRQLPGFHIRGACPGQSNQRLASETPSYRKMGETENVHVLLEF